MWAHWNFHFVPSALRCRTCAAENNIYINARAQVDRATTTRREAHMHHCATTTMAAAHIFCLREFKKRAPHIYVYKRKIGWWVGGVLHGRRARRPIDIEVVFAYMHHTKVEAFPKAFIYNSTHMNMCKMWNSPHRILRYENMWRENMPPYIYKSVHCAKRVRGRARTTIIDRTLKYNTNAWIQHTYVLYTHTHTHICFPCAQQVK